LKVLFIGDWGWQLFGIFRGQQRVAEAMSAWADSNRPAWIQTTGDNIYPMGIHSWDDPQVDSKWRHVYDQPSLKKLVWHVAVGNHDYGVRLTEEWNQVPLFCVYNFSLYSNAMCFTPSTGPLRHRII